jgi:hypothetical protein
MSFTASFTAYQRVGHSGAGRRRDSQPSADLLGSARDVSPIRVAPDDAEATGPAAGVVVAGCPGCSEAVERAAAG